MPGVNGANDSVTMQISSWCHLVTSSNLEHQLAAFPLKRLGNTAPLGSSLAKCQAMCLLSMWVCQKKKEECIVSNVLPGVASSSLMPHYYENDILYHEKQAFIIHSFYSCIQMKTGTIQYNSFSTFFSCKREKTWIMMKLVVSYWCSTQNLNSTVACFKSGKTMKALNSTAAVISYK